jgi:MobC-like protein
MSEQKTNRNKWIHLRLTENEHKKIQNSFSRTTSRKLSEYVRNVLLGKPVTVYTRNQSTDLFVAELISLKNELSAIGNNFNQAVKKLHTLDHVSEIKLWAEYNEKSKKLFFSKVEEINQKINQISDKWLHE